MSELNEETEMDIDNVMKEKQNNDDDSALCLWRGKVSHSETRFLNISNIRELTSNSNLILQAIYLNV